MQKESIKVGERYFQISKQAHNEVIIRNESEQNIFLAILNTFMIFGNPKN